MLTMIQKTILHLHALTAVITITLFIVRFFGKQLHAKFMRQRWVRILPHLNDTCLLIFGITLIILTQQYPNLASQRWLTEKLCFLIAYILFGFIALKSNKVYFRYLGFILALATFACIIYLVKLKHAF